MDKQKRSPFFLMYNMRYQLKNRRSFLLSIITIAVGIAIYLSIQSVVLMSESQILSTAYAKAGGDVSFILKDGLLSDGVYQELQGLEEDKIAEYTTSFWMQGTISAQKRNSMCTIRYIDPQKYPFYKTESDHCDYSTLLNGNNLLISEKLASSLDVKAGDSIMLQGIENSMTSSYTIADIVPEDGEDSFDMNIYGYVFIDKGSLFELFGEDSEKIASKVYIKCRDSVKEKVKKEISVENIVDADSEVETITKEVKSSNTSYKGMGMLAIIISFIGIISSMILMVLKRQKDICIFKIYGAGSWDIVKLFLSEILVITFIGVTGGIVLGVACSYGICFIVQGHFVHILALSGIYAIIVKVIGLGIICGVISGMIPIILTLQFKPVSILREQTISAGNLRRMPLIIGVLGAIFLFGGIYFLMEKSVLGFAIPILGILLVFILLMLVRFFMWMVIMCGCIGKKNTTGKIAMKSMRKDRMKFSLAILVISFSVAVISMVLLMYNSILPSLESQVKNSLGYDALFKVNAERELEVSNAVEKSGADTFYQSTVVDFSLVAVNHRKIEVQEDYLYTIDCMHDNLSYVNDKIIEGEGLKNGSGKKEVVVDQDFYEQYNMHVKDSITIQIGDAEYDFIITGVRESDKIKTGQLYVNYDAVKECVENKILRYYVVCQQVDDFITHFNKNCEDILVLNIKDIAAPYADTLNQQMLILKLISLLCICSAILLIFNILSITYMAKQKEFLIFGLYGAGQNQKKRIIVTQGFVLGVVCIIVAFFISIFGALILEVMTGISINYDGITFVELIGLSILCSEGSTLMISTKLVRYSEYTVLRSE